MGILQALASLGSQGITTLARRIFGAVASATGTKAVTLTLNTDGTISVVRSSGATNTIYVDSGPTNWYTPTTGGIGTSWYARLDSVSMSSGVFTGTLTTGWQQLNTSKTLIASAADNNTVAGTANIELSTSGSGPATVVLPVNITQEGWYP